MSKHLMRLSAFLASCVWLFLAPCAAAAQSAPRTVVTIATAPVFASPNANQTPLRVAKEGSVLLLMNTNPEWTQIEFQDPQFGRRSGYIQTKFVRTDSLPSRETGRMSPQLSRTEPRLPEPAVSEGLARIGERRGDVAVGYGLMHDVDGTLPIGISGSNGWTVQPGIDLVVEAQYSRGTGDFPVGEVDGDILTALAGPRFRIKSRYGDGAQPFFQVLGGMVRAKVNFGSFASHTTTGLGVQPGIGVDVPLNRSVAVRPQFGWLVARLDGVNTSAARVSLSVVVGLSP